MNVLEIVRKHLSDNGYDGLFMPNEECGCFTEDLAPCGEMLEICEAGVKKFRDGIMIISEPTGMEDLDG